MALSHLHCKRIDSVVVDGVYDVVIL